MFKNATLYRIGPDWAPTLPDLEDRLARHRFVECGATQPMAIGFVEPRGVAHGPLVESVGGQWLLRLVIETKVVPGAVIKRRTDEHVLRIEAETGRKPGRRQAKEIKEAVLLELLPMAFTKQAAVALWIDPAARLMLVDSASANRADEVVSFLVKAVDGIPLAMVQTAVTPAAAMSDWLLSHEPPPGFTIDRECELQSTDEMKSVVRYARHTLDIDEVRAHITGGKRPTRLAMSWRDRVSFTLGESLQLRKITFLEVEADQGSQGGDDGFDADVAIATGELRQLIPDVIEALGGEADGLGGAAAAPVTLDAVATSPAAPANDEREAA